MSTKAKMDSGSSSLSTLGSGPTKVSGVLGTGAQESSSSVARSTLGADKTVTVRTVRGQSVTVPYDVTREEARRANRAANSADAELVLDPRSSR